MESEQRWNLMTVPLYVNVEHIHNYINRTNKKQHSIQILI